MPKNEPIISTVEKILFNERLNIYAEEVAVNEALFETMADACIAITADECQAYIKAHIDYLDEHLNGILLPFYSDIPAVLRVDQAQLSLPGLQNLFALTVYAKDLTFTIGAWQSNYGSRSLLEVKNDLHDASELLVLEAYRKESAQNIFDTCDDICHLLANRNPLHLSDLS